MENQQTQDSQIFIITQNKQSLIFKEISFQRNLNRIIQLITTFQDIEKQYKNPIYNLNVIQEYDQRIYVYGKLKNNRQFTIQIDNLDRLNVPEVNFLNYVRFNTLNSIFSVFAFQQSLDQGKNIKIMEMSSNNSIIFYTTGTANQIYHSLYKPYQIKQPSNILIMGVCSIKKKQSEALIQMIKQPCYHYQDILDFQVKCQDYIRINKDWQGNFVQYNPNFPSFRKDEECLSCLLKNDYVILEKPAFANSIVSQQFLDNLEKEQLNIKHVLVAWQHVHNPVAQELIRLSRLQRKMVNIDIIYNYPKSLDNKKDIRLFTNKQGGVSINIFIDCLHLVMVLNQGKIFSNIISSEYKDYSLIDKKYKFIETYLKSEVQFENGCIATMQSCMDSDIDLCMKFQILFDDGFRIKGNLLPWTVHDKNYTIIKKDKNLERWNIYEFERGDDIQNSFDYQFDFWAKYISKQINYDIINDDIRGVGLKFNQQVQKGMDLILKHAGLPERSGYY